MLRKLLPVLFLLLCINARSQNPIVDSLKLQLTRLQKPADRIDVLGRLSMMVMNMNMAEAEKYGKQMKEEAEVSRDRKLIFKSLISNAQRCLALRVNQEFVQRSLDNYNQALELANKNKMDRESAEAMIGLSSAYLQVPDLEKALNNVTQASSIASSLNNDSLKVAVFNQFGSVYLSKKERLLALRNFLTALTIAEEIKKPDLLFNCYSNLMFFYSDIKDQDKAIDYAQKALDQLSLMKTGMEAYSRLVNLYYIGTFYMSKKDFDMSQYYFEKSIRVADSLKFSQMKMPAYSGLLNQYLISHQPQKALDYFRSGDLAPFMSKLGLGYRIDFAYGVIYTELGKFDSAKYYFDKAAPQFEASTTPAFKLGFYAQYGDYYKQSGNGEKEIEYFEKAQKLAEQTSDLDWQRRIAKELDSAYAKKGNYQLSYHYSSIYNQLKDSLQKLGEEKDMMQMEAANEQQRQERKAREEEALMERRHTVQYTAITIGIALVFLFLVLMGAFKVSATTIRVMGFFAFILLFEFIILLADTKIHHWTGGEPLPVLGIKIILIAMLLPLHHWLEHKVVHYLASRRLILPDRKSVWNMVSRKKKPQQVDS
jgi:tetratricopeptide (TPR) repeat protein